MNKYSDMSDFEINKAVAVALGEFIEPPYGASTEIIGDVLHYFESDRELVACHKDYCNNPSDAWPIIVENTIQFNYDTAQVHCDSYFMPSAGKVSLPHAQALRAAMIVYLMIKDAENECN